MFYSHQLLARKAPLGQICEEILNPPVPMALRVSGILLGGVVLVYERKVKLLYEDASQLTEINQASPIKPATVLPKGKARAKYEAVTLPEKIINMVGEQPKFFVRTDGASFRGMQLDDLDEQYVQVNLDDDDFSHADHRHQAEAVNITVVDNFESGLAETDVFNRFERFDIADDKTTVNITPDKHTQVPSTLLPSPPRQEDPQQKEQYYAAPSPFHEEPQQGGPEEQEERKMKQPPKASKRKARRDDHTFTQQQQSPKASKRKARRELSQVIMDNDQMMIPENISTHEFTPQATGVYETETGGLPMGVEQSRAKMSVIPEEAHDTLHSDHSVTPGSPGLSLRSSSRSGGSGRALIPLDPEVQLTSGSGRRSKRARYSSARSLGNLDTVEEDFPLERKVMEIKKKRLSDYAPTPDLLKETEPTQTPYERRSNPMDKVTEAIMSHLRLHFDSPGAPQSESLSHLAHGMTKARAAQLFYQTTVLATGDYIKVTQLEPNGEELYGDILISRGPKM